MGSSSSSSTSVRGKESPFDPLLHTPSPSSGGRKEETKAKTHSTKQDKVETHRENTKQRDTISHGNNKGLPSHRPEEKVIYSSPGLEVKNGVKKADTIDHSVTTFTSEKIDDEGNNAKYKSASEVSHVISNPSNGVSIISLTSKNKDLSAYKRDYFVPSSRDNKQFEESLNGFEEKVSIFTSSVYDYILLLLRNLKVIFNDYCLLLSSLIDL